MPTEIQEMDIATPGVSRRYRFLGKLGSGGMADVFLGIERGERDITRLVAVKRLHREAIESTAVNTVEMFIEEARTVAALNHPHIVKIFDLLPHNGTVHITMEYVDGETLQTIIAQTVRQHDKIPLPVICRWVADAATALHYAHNATSLQGEPLGLIHRDIDMRNLMVDRSGYLKIIDFGVAQSLCLHNLQGKNLTFMGKVSYAAPEVFTAPDKIDHRVDLYALGLVLHALVTQKKPYPSKSASTTDALVKKVIHEPLIPVRTVDPSLPEALETLIAKATHKEPSARFQSGEEFADAVEAFAQAYEGIATPQEVQRWYRAKFAERIALRESFVQSAMERARAFIETDNLKDDEPERDSKTPSLVLPSRIAETAAQASIDTAIHTEAEPLDEDATIVLRFPRLHRFRHNALWMAAALCLVVLSLLAAFGSVRFFTEPAPATDAPYAVEPRASDASQAAGPPSSPIVPMPESPPLVREFVSEEASLADVASPKTPEPTQAPPYAGHWTKGQAAARRSRQKAVDINPGDIPTAVGTTGTSTRIEKAFKNKVHLLTRYDESQPTGKHEAGKREAPETDNETRTTPRKLHVLESYE